MKVSLKIAGWIFLLYGVVEIYDVVNNVFRMFGIVLSEYPQFYFEPVNKLFHTAPPYYTFLFVLIPTTLHFLAGLSIILKKSWGVFLAVFSSLFSICVFVFFLPLGVLDGVFTTVAIIFLAIGYSGQDSNIVIEK